MASFDLLGCRLGLSPAQNQALVHQAAHDLGYALWFDGSVHAVLILNVNVVIIQAFQ